MRRLRGDLPRTPRQRALAAAKGLREAYPADCALVHANPLELLVATILSAQTTDARVNQVTPELFERMRCAADYASAAPAQLEALIHPTGFFRAKSRSLIGMGKVLVEEFDGEVPTTMAELIKVPGVGRKTANVILGVAFGIPGFPVDTHVGRLTNLLGIVKTRDPVKIEREVCRMLPSSDWTAFSLRLIAHGRGVCVARRPRCGACIFWHWCPSSQAPGEFAVASVSDPESVAPVSP
ncbi:MAG TPA: endonuclease III [Candidatus Dormibacteraeota bacterium]|nr:endonuclease III [Candidatus Dormibacteraeota bacterium]